MKNLTDTLNANIEVLSQQNSAPVVNEPANTVLTNININQNVYQQAQPTTKPAETQHKDSYSYFMGAFGQQDDAFYKPNLQQKSIIRGLLLPKNQKSLTLKSIYRDQFDKQQEILQRL